MIERWAKLPGQFSVVALDILHMLKGTEICYSKPYSGEIGEYPATWLIYNTQIMDIMVPWLSVHHRQAVFVKKYHFSIKSRPVTCFTVLKEAVETGGQQPHNHIWKSFILNVSENSAKRSGFFFFQIMQLILILKDLTVFDSIYDSFAIYIQIDWVSRHVVLVTFQPNWRRRYSYRSTIQNNSWCRRGALCDLYGSSCGCDVECTYCYDE